MLRTHVFVEANKHPSTIVNPTRGTSPAAGQFNRWPKATCTTRNTSAHTIFPRPTDPVVFHAATLARFQELLSYATRLNEYKTVIGAQLQYFDAWRKLCNIYFIVAPPHVVPFQLRFSLLMELIRSLLQIVSARGLRRTYRRPILMNSFFFP